MSTTVEVCAAVIRDGSRLLVARRARPADLAGLWEFPGGKLEPGETAAACLRRELLEELDLAIEVGGFLGDSIRPAASAGDQGWPELRLSAYSAALSTGAGAPRLVDGTHDRVAWVTADELLALELAPLDVPLRHAALATLTPGASPDVDLR